MLGEDGASPIVGTVLILGITVAGIAAVLMWGAPVLQDMQDQASQTTAVNWLIESRDASARLAGIDSSRKVDTGLTGGTLRLADGGNILVAASHEVGCSPDLDGWLDGDAVVTLPTAACSLLPAAPATCALGADPCARAYMVDGRTLTEVTATHGVAGLLTLSTNIDLRASDWAIRVESNDGATIYHEYWMLSSDSAQWDSRSGAGEQSATYLWGIVQSTKDDAVFSEAPLRASEDAFQSGDYMVRIPTLSTQQVSINSRGVHSMLIGLNDLSGPISSDDVRQIRYEIAGHQSEGLCGGITIRNLLLDVPGYTDCTLDGDEVENVYATMYPLVATGSAFKMEFIHAKLQIEFQS